MWSELSNIDPLGVAFLLHGATSVEQKGAHRVNWKVTPQSPETQVQE